jgi:glutamine synthetase
MMAEGETLKTYEGLYDMPVKKLPGTIYEAIGMYENSTFIREVMGEENRMKYLELKLNAAKRSPEALGTRVKNGEVIYHHEVYNQVIWNNF